MSETAEPIYKVHAALVAAPATGESAQGDDELEFGTPNGAIEPPESLERIAAWTQMNGTRGACIRAVVRNTVGLGYTMGLADGADAAGADQVQRFREASQKLEALAHRDKRLGSPTFTKLMEAVKWDKAEIGNGYLEVSRDRLTGAISGLFYAPGKRVRRRRERDGYLMVPANGDWGNATRFYNFGEKVLYGRDGTPRNRLDGAKRWNVNELIPFREFTSESRDYGLPVDIALALEYLGDKLAAASNVGFFDSSGTPPTVLYVTGEERKDGQTIHVSVPAETAQRIAQTMKAGANRQNRVAIVPVPPGAKLDKVELGRVSDKDMGFTTFRDDLRQRTISAWRLSPIFIALSSEGRYDAEVERAITKEQVFDGEQTEDEERLHRTLLMDLGYGDLGLTFNDLAVEDNAAKREGATRSAEAGTITRREFRKAYGYPPLPEAPAATAEIVWHDGDTYKSAEPEPGQVPHGWHDRLVNIGQPPGAENRVDAASDQRGQQPGVGARVARSGSQEQPRAARNAPVQAAVESLTGAAGSRVRGGARRATARARALVDEE